MMSESKDSGGTKCSPTRSVLNIDHFAEAIEFRLPGGPRRYRSCKGVCFTVFLLTAMLLYGTMQAIKLASHADADTRFNSKEYHFDSSYEFNDGLQIAFAVSAYDSEQGPIEDPSIGVMKPFFKMWGFDGGSTKFKEIPTRNCTEEELIDPESNDSLFYKPQPHTAGDLAYYYQKLKCLDIDTSVMI